MQKHILEVSEILTTKPCALLAYKFWITKAVDAKRPLAHWHSSRGALSTGPCRLWFDSSGLLYLYQNRSPNIFWNCPRSERGHLSLVMSLERLVKSPSCWWHQGIALTITAKSWTKRSRRRKMRKLHWHPGTSGQLLAVGSKKLCIHFGDGSQLHRPKPS